MIVIELFACDMSGIRYDAYFHYIAFHKYTFDLQFDATTQMRLLEIKDNNYHHRLRNIRQ